MCVWCECVGCMYRCGVGMGVHIHVCSCMHPLVAHVLYCLDSTQPAELPR